MKQLSRRKTPSRIILLPRRYVVCLLVFMGLFILYSLRVNLSVAVVVLTNDYQVMLDNGTIIQVKECNWSSKEKGIILSSFFYGYIISEFPGGWLAGRFGGATILGIEMLLSSLFTFLIPFVVNYRPAYVFIFRALLGIFEGGSLPCTHAIWSRWAPNREKTALTTISFMGGNMASSVCFSLFGLLAVTYGWRSLFYVPGCVGLLWCIMWFAFVKNDPSEDAWITQSELHYIQNTTVKKPDETVIYPWKSILMSVPMWSIAFAYFCRTWGYTFYSSELPSYFHDVWKMNVKDSGILITIPYLVVFIIALLSAVFADHLIANVGYSVTLVRKIFHTVGEVGAAVCFFLVGYSNSTSMATILIAISKAFYSISFCSILSGALDIAPQYSSVIMGIMTTVASLASILVPTITGFIVGHASQYEWSITFFICSGVIAVGSVIYILFASGEVQPWARIDRAKKVEV